MEMRGALLIKHHFRFLQFQNLNKKEVLKAPLYIS